MRLPFLLALALLPVMAAAQTLEITQPQNAPLRNSAPVYTPPYGDITQGRPMQVQPAIPNIPGYVPSVPAPPGSEPMPTYGGPYNEPPMSVPVQPPITATPPPEAPPVAPPISSTDMSVRLRVIDKTAATKKIMRVPIGTVLQYKTLEIVPDRCYLDPSHKPQPATAARLEIFERKPGATPTRLFSGWMYADAPSASHLNHRYFDVAVLECVSKEAAAAEDAKVAEPTTAPAAEEAPTAVPEAPASED